MIYVDTSILVTALTIETKTVEMQAWLQDDDRNDGLAISDWTISEFSSALSIKVRGGLLPTNDHLKALQAFRALTAESFSILAVERRHFRTAATLCDDYGAPIKASDVLHAAIALEAGASLATLDRQLAKAFGKIGGRALLV
jgi:predicted nucleic acid-binding protein